MFSNFGSPCARKIVPAKIRIGRGPKTNSLWEITRDPSSFRSILTKCVVDVNSTFGCSLALEYIDVTRNAKDETINTLLHRHHYLHHSHRNISNNLQILIYPALYLYRLDIPRACITPIDNGIIHESERQYYKFPPGSGITEFPYREVSTIWRIKALDGKDCNGVRVFNGNWKIPRWFSMG